MQSHALAMERRSNAESVELELAIPFPLQGGRQCYQWRDGLSREATLLLCVSHGHVLKGPSKSLYEPRYGLSLIQVPVGGRIAAKVALVRCCDRALQGPVAMLK